MNPDPIYALILFGEVIHVSDEHVYIVYKRDGDLIETSLRKDFLTVPKVGDQVAARTTINRIDPPPPPFSYPPQQRNVVPLPRTF